MNAFWTNPFENLWDLLREYALPSPIDEEDANSCKTEAGQVNASGSTQTETFVPSPRQTGLEQTAPTKEALPESNFLKPQSIKEVAEVPRQPLDARGRRCLEDVRRYASWTGAEGERRLNAGVEIFRAEYPGNEEAIATAVAEGRQLESLLKKAYKLGGGGKPKGEIEKLIEDHESILSSDFLIKKMWKQYDNGRAAFERYNSERTRKRAGQELSSVTVPDGQISPTVLPASPLSQRRDRPRTPSLALHPNDLRGLPPETHWQLIIDETGDTFDDRASAVKALRVGRFVGILVPGDKPVLQPLKKGWHAVTEKSEEIDHVVQSILNSRVGVFGIDVRHVPSARGERWMDGVTLLIDWVLRLLPIQERVKIEVLIEQRGVFQSGQSWEQVERDCLRRLALAYPNRARCTDLRVQVIGKEGSSLNGYVDAIAFTWAKTSASSKERLKKSKWDGTCLLTAAGQTDARSMMNAWDAFAQGVNLPPSLWWDMLSSPDVGNPGSVLSNLLDMVGHETKLKTDLWSAFLTEIKSRMASTPVNLLRLSAAVDWLQNYEPGDAKITPMMRLVWLTVQLARANHLGSVEEGWLIELDALERDLFDEAAPLVCHADLHRAVAATNRYDFVAAESTLEKWRDCTPSVPGLRYWAQVKSSLGQHSAFMGNFKSATEFFTEALSAFARLSDPDTRKRDELQTACYLAIVLTDWDDVDAKEVRRSVERVTGPLPAAATRLATTNASEDRYAHHLLLRWLVFRGDADVRQAYLESEDSWKEGEGHPWELIQLYRSILLHSIDEKRALALALNGAWLAFAEGQGPTVRLIGACCRAVAVAWGSPWPQAENELNDLVESIPLAKAEIEILRKSLVSRVEPATLLKQVLPFNFR